MVRDLGIFLDKNWTFSEHISRTVSKSFKTLGFIKRTTLAFSSLDTITYLFKTLVLPNLNYASIIWSPFTQDKFEDLNSVLKRFLRFASFKTGNPMNFTDHNYKNISLKCNLHKVETMHKVNDLYFILNNLKKKIVFPPFDDLFVYREIDYLLRHIRPFLEETLKNNYIFYAPINRMKRYWNELPENYRQQLILTSDKSALKKDFLQYF